MGGVEGTVTSVAGNLMCSLRDYAWTAHLRTRTQRSRPSSDASRQSVVALPISTLGPLGQ